MQKNYIYREEYGLKVSPFIGKTLIKVFTGQRRVGKSYIMLQTADYIKRLKPKANIIFIDKELDDFSKINNNKDLYKYVNGKLKSTENYLFVDEIQEIANFELCLRSFLNEKKCDIYCTGSNAQLLSGELATRLAGRYVVINVHALSYREFLIFHKLPDTNETLVKYLTIGGLPYLSQLSDNQNTAFEYIKNVYSSILLKDVVARENIRNVAFLESLTAYLINNLGNLFSALNISKYLKSQQIGMTPQTVMNYLKALCNAFFVYRVQRADVNGLKIFESNEKYYFEDLGLRNAVRSFKFTQDVGKLMENAVYMHLLRCGFTVFVGKLGSAEIDFIAERNNSRIYIQVAYMIYDETVRQREFGNLMNIRDQYPKYVVSMDEFSDTNYMGIKQMHLRDFLKQDL